MKDFILVSLIRCMGCLPLKWLRACGNAMGCLIYSRRGRSYQITATNTAIAFPQLSPEEADCFVRNSLKEAAKTGLEACAIWTRSCDWLNKHIVKIEGEELLKQYLSDSRGLVVLTPHHGNWEALSGFLTQYGATTAIYQPLHKFKRTDCLVRNARAKAGLRMVTTSQSGVLQLFKALKRGEIVMILPDQVPAEQYGGHVAEFFGHPAKTMTLVDGLVQRARPQVCGCYAERVPGGFKIVVVPPDERIFSTDTCEAVRGLNATIERCVKDAPTQYQWEYKRYKHLQAPFHYLYKKA